MPKVVEWLIKMQTCGIINKNRALVLYLINMDRVKFAIYQINNNLLSVAKETHLYVGSIERNKAMRTKKKRANSI